ncbi:MAG: RsbRD N-terminal domain-containing protein [Bacillota bacterium]
MPGLNLEDLLSERKGAIVEAWLDLTLQAYPPEAVRFLRSEPDPFANPVGKALRRDLAGLFEGLVCKAGYGEVHPFLDEAMRIRAVQGVPPSQSIGFLFLLKTVVRAELAGALQEGQVTPDQLWAFDARVDELALSAFDVYMQCRERIYEVRVGEVKNRTFRLLQKAHLLVAGPEAGPSDARAGNHTGPHDPDETGG